MAGMPVIIRGELYRTDVEVGGGPMPPGEGAPPDVGIWPSPGHPAHPIVLPPYLPAHPIVIPPGFIDGAHPEHPIVIPMPPSIWPGRPAHPIVIPPDVGIWPDDGKPTHPIVIPPPPTVWPPVPTHPIVLPPDGDGGVTPTPDPKWEVKCYWTEEGGWGVALVPTEAHPGVPVPAAGS